MACYCKLCKTFIHDWLTQPFAPFQGKIREKAFHRILPILVNEIQLLYCELYPHFSYINGKYALLPLELMCQTKEELFIYVGLLIVKEMKQLPTSSTLSCIIACLEDNYIFETYENLEKWIGYVMQNLWITLPDMHNEHTHVKRYSIEVYFKPIQLTESDLYD